MLFTIVRFNLTSLCSVVLAILISLIINVGISYAEVSFCY